jgi:hypothetical protein
MNNITTAHFEKWLGKRRMSKVGRMWAESGGIMVVLKDGLTNEKWDTNGRFVLTDELIADIKSDLLEFFDDVVEEKE